MRPAFQLLMNSRKTNSVAEGCAGEFAVGWRPRPAFALLGVLALTLTLAGQDSFAGQRVRIDQLTTDPDTKFQVLNAMAKDLGTHRNRLILLKKETGQSFADIYAAELRNRGVAEQAIMDKLRMVS